MTAYSCSQHLITSHTFEDAIIVTATCCILDPLGRCSQSLYYTLHNTLYNTLYIVEYIVEYIVQYIIQYIIQYIVHYTIHCIHDQSHPKDLVKLRPAGITR